MGNLKLSQRKKKNRMKTLLTVFLLCLLSACSPSSPTVSEKPSVTKTPITGAFGYVLGDLLKEGEPDGEGGFRLFDDATNHPPFMMVSVMADESRRVYFISATAELVDFDRSELNRSMKEKYGPPQLFSNRFMQWWDTNGGITWNQDSGRLTLSYSDRVISEKMRLRERAAVKKETKAIVDKL